MRFNNNSINDDPDTNYIFKGVHNKYALGTSPTKKKDYFEIMDDMTLTYKACDLYNSVNLYPLNLFYRVTVGNNNNSFNIMK